MAKRKNKDPGAAPQLHPQRSFEQIVADATLSRLGGYIDGQIQQLGQALSGRLQQSFTKLFTRLVAVEELLMEKTGLTKDDFTTRVAVIEDRSEGFTQVDADVAAELGDRVRLEIRTKTADQTEYQGSSRMLVDNAGSGNTLGAELESAVVGMKAGETKEVLFGKDNSLSASITISRISRQPQPQPTAETAEAAPAEAPAQEAPNANADAG
jgi:hypothetical protein